jgi:hypothetical protein
MTSYHLQVNQFFSPISRTYTTFRIIYTPPKPFILVPFANLYHALVWYSSHGDETDVSLDCGRFYGPLYHALSHPSFLCPYIIQCNSASISRIILYNVTVRQYLALFYTM